MIFDILVAMIISPQECTQKFDPSAKDMYINYQLKQSNGKSPVTFIANIEKIYHEHIISEADKAGWYVYIERVPDPMYPAWMECYKFTFTSK